MESIGLQIAETRVRCSSYGLTLPPREVETHCTGPTVLYLSLPAGHTFFAFIHLCVVCLRLGCCGRAREAACVSRQCGHVSVSTLLYSLRLSCLEGCAVRTRVILGDNVLEARNPHQSLSRSVTQHYCVFD